MRTVQLMAPCSHAALFEDRQQTEFKLPKNYVLSKELHARLEAQQARYIELAAILSGAQVLTGHAMLVHKLGQVYEYSDVSERYRQRAGILICVIPVYPQSCACVHEGTHKRMSFYCVLKIRPGPHVKEVFSNYSRVNKKV